MPANGHTKCMNPLCTRKKAAIKRGLCENCYQRACYLIKYHGATWESLERSGKVLPSKQGRQVTKANSWFDDALEAAELADEIPIP